MDRFFASVPGPTWPNRMFALTGTSAGELVGVLTVFVLPRYPAVEAHRPKSRS